MDLCCKGIEFLSFVQGSDHGSANRLNEGLCKTGMPERVNNGDPASHIATTVAIRNVDTRCRSSVSNAQTAAIPDGGGRPSDRDELSHCQPSIGMAGICAFETFERRLELT